MTEAKRGGRWDRIRIARFIREDPITKRRLQALAPADIAQWRDSRLKQVKPGSVAREMNLIAAILEIARKEWGWLKENPMRDVRQPPKPKGEGASNICRRGRGVGKGIRCLGFAGDRGVAESHRVACGRTGPTPKGRSWTC